MRLRKSTSVVVGRSSPTTAASSVGDGDQAAWTPQEPSSGLRHQLHSITHRRKSRTPLSGLVESPRSAASKYYQEAQLRKQHSLAELRRRIVRKASTFNLHTRHRSALQNTATNPRNDHLFLDSGQNSASADRTSFLLVPDERPSTASTRDFEALESIERAENSDSSSAYSQVTTVPARRHTLASGQPVSENTFSNSQRAPLKAVGCLRKQQILQAQSEIVRKYSNYREKHIDASGVWVKMATPGAAPPLPFEKMKQITVEACESALGTTDSYDHSKTENWNTTIINTILSQLVGETDSQEAQQQSKWKFVVNSTIIQHRSTSIVDENGKQVSGGRRGMHSAAGAYWNNEHDGMWSFKYEAADKMGLDVIVGIVWILVS